VANPLRQLADYGQSFWLDNLSRPLIASGELAQLIEDDGLRGVTSNPTIFEKALSTSDEYDMQIRELIADGKNNEEVFEELAIRDVQMAADLLRPVYDQSQGQHGFVSFELPPYLASQTEQSIAEARRLFVKIGRPNAMIKVPGTPEGIPAVEELIAEGLNINITLLFSVDTYERVAEAYIRGLERCVAEEEPINHIASVASFFVSRVDTEVDSRIDQLLADMTDEQRRMKLESLRGEVAIANAKVAYQRCKKIFMEGKRFKRLADEYGARMQEPLWASTSTKNPTYSDVKYIEALIGPHTVATMAPVSVTAFRDHGVVQPTIEENVDDAYRTLGVMREVGIGYEDVTRTLQSKGVKSFG
jgi:transaldolase / glucose-6-phosphate isomerase